MCSEYRFKILTGIFTQVKFSTFINQAFKLRAYYVFVPINNYYLYLKIEIMTYQKKFGPIRKRYNKFAFE